MYRLVGRQGSTQLGRATTGSASWQRGLAVPVNKRSSVDPLLGVAPPAPPKPQDDQASSSSSADTLPNFLAGTSRPNNPNDLSELLRGNKLPGFQRNGHRSKTSAAIGAMRRGAGSTIPTQDLEDAFLPPEAPGASTSEQQSAADTSNEQAQTPVDRETPHPIDAFYGRNDLDERILAAARAVHHARQNGSAAWMHASTIPSLLEDFTTRSERTLSVELPNESQPKGDRRVPLTSARSSEAELDSNLEDGVLLIAYITGLTGPRGNERISVCSGFAVEGGQHLAEGESNGKGPLVVTCAHTLRGSIPARPKSTPPKDSDESSIALAITRSGEIFPITSLLSSLPISDLVLLQLGEEAIIGGSEEGALGAPLTISPAKIRTLPLSPYPAQVGSELCVSSFWGWEDDAGSTLPAFEFHAGPETSSGSENGLQVRSSASLIISAKTLAPPAGREKDIIRKERDDAGRSRWGRARLVEYRDVSGQEALPGTYDELAQLDFKLLADNPNNPPALQQKAQGGAAAFPPAGSSGGPIVDVLSGSVVAVALGTKTSQLGGTRGYGIPAERVFFFFALPGFPKKI
jgi:hypothetical protein